MTRFLVLFIAAFMVVNAINLADATVAKASYYSYKDAGKLTASGEVFDPNALTAASPNLPFGTEVLVINLENGKFVKVRINDRGPFVAGRAIDLSYAAAEQIDMVKKGVVTVAITVLT